ncbi:MAG: cbb3-type cytochrome c oxidase N-terminal domain-containing protein [Candidatus Neomarinimicrobiota bacterium]
MAKIEKEHLLDHNFDGIRELDNFLPRWWKWLFIFTIVFSIGYILHYHVFKTGDLQDVEYYKELNPEWAETDLKMVGPSFRYNSPYKRPDAGEVVARVEISDIEENMVVGEPVVLAVLIDSESIEKGKSIYATNCMACHGASGEGLIGPNFCDSYWIHGGSVDDIVRIINVGVPAKGMIPWDKTLTPEQILQVASYILSLEKTDPPNQKAAEGELYIKS